MRPERSRTTGFFHSIHSCAMAWVLTPAVLLLPAGCGRTGPPPAKAAPQPPPKVVLDYRWGWYHTADGGETIRQIAGLYERDAALLGRLNQLSPEARPNAGRMIYVPPNNDVNYVRQALVHINRNPGIVPTQPWHPSMARKVAEPVVAEAPTPVKSAEEGLKSVVSRKPRPALSLDVDDAPVRSRSSRPARPAPSANERAVAQAGVDDGDGPPGRLRGTGDGPRFDWPLRGKVATPFSEGWHKACHGIEIAAAEGASVRASRSGKILFAQQFPGYGRLILIDHGDGYASVYAYLRKMLVKEGNRVDQGQTIATTGSKGSTPLLFFQIRKQGRKVDPMDYLE
jgi:murein DD-endopeptidase MepM/ murein hydrolase activator NlpD